MECSLQEKKYDPVLLLLGLLVISLFVPHCECQRPVCGSEGSGATEAVDIMWIIDYNQSFDYANFLALKHFLSDMMLWFRVTFSNTYGTRHGCLLYSNTEHVLLSYKISVRKAQGSFLFLKPPRQHRTDLEKAFYYLSKTKVGSDRQTVQNVAVVITDAKSLTNSRVFSAARNLTAKGWDIVTIGVTSENNDNLLKRLSSRPRFRNQNYFSVSSIQKLRSMKFQEELARGICGRNNGVSVRCGVCEKRSYLSTNSNDQSYQRLGCNPYELPTAETRTCNGSLCLYRHSYYKFADSNYIHISRECSSVASLISKGLYPTDYSAGTCVTAAAAKPVISHWKQEVNAAGKNPRDIIAYGNQSYICVFDEVTGFVPHLCSDGKDSWSCKVDDCGSNPCQNGATCRNVRRGGFTCLCAGDYFGVRCELQKGKFGPVVITSSPLGKLPYKYAVRWTKPSTKGMPIKEYRLQLQQVKVDDMTGVVKKQVFKRWGYLYKTIPNVDNLVRMYMFNNLDPDSYYEVVITARNELGWNTPTKFVFHTMPETQDWDSQLSVKDVMAWAKGFLLINQGDLCASNPCLNGGTCANLPKLEFHCHCPTGITGTFCEVDIDDCVSNPCQNGGMCQNLRGQGYVCTCTGHYEGTECQEVKAIESVIDMNDLEPKNSTANIASVLEKDLEPEGSSRSKRDLIIVVTVGIASVGVLAAVIAFLRKCRKPSREEADVETLSIATYPNARSAISLNTNPDLPPMEKQLDDIR